MGSLSSKPLAFWSKEEVADAVTTLGSKYEEYAKSIRDNGVDGKLLVTLGEGEFKETLADLDITSRLHTRVLMAEWNAIKDATTTEETKYNDSSETLSDESQDAYLQKVFEAAAEYEVKPDTAPEELEPFDIIANHLMELFHAQYAGIHLLNPDGHTSASSRYIFADTPHKVETKRLHQSKSASFCYKLWATERNKSIVMRPLPQGYSAFHHPDETPTYLGHVLRAPTGERIGMICVVVGEKFTQGKGQKEEWRNEILRALAVEAEQQLNSRKVLLERNRKLDDQISKLQPTGVATLATVQPQLPSDMSLNLFPVVLPRASPVIDISPDDVERRNREHKSMYTSKDGRRRSSRMPAALLDVATRDEMKHIPPSSFDQLDAKGIDRTPVPKNDMERVASLQSLGLPNIGPKHAATIELNKLVQLAVSLFDMPIALISMMSHDVSYSICVHTSATVPKSVVDFLVANDTPFRFDSDGKPFCLKGDRFGCTCNYVVAMKRSYTCHDFFSDESFAYLKDIPGACRFFSGSPVMWRGYVVAGLCLLDHRARLDFGATQELQLEHIAQLISQQIENWALRQDMEYLENERRRLSTLGCPKSSPPEDYAALVFTDIQGSTKLWEFNSKAMHGALQIHDDIMRQLIAKHCGYEIATAGDSFHVAFHDAIDAVQFTLDAQEALHNAPWGDDVRAMPDASDDSSKCFSGLRVRMAIHYGPVTCKNNAVSGRLEYSGSTVFITKSLEDMAHGGQILVTSDVWNVASYVAESKLGSPQVVDLGLHVLRMGNALHEGVIAKGVLQLVPTSLAFDFFAARTLSQSTGEDAIRLTQGRRFPSPITQKQISASFHDAPYEGNYVTMAFIYTCAVEKAYNEDPAIVLAALADVIGTLLRKRGRRSGYQCKDFMLAFSTLHEAVDFGLNLQEELRDNPVLPGVNLGGLIKIGIHEGIFTSMGPHRTTGRADYYGKVVNRSARIAGAAEPGDVCVGLLDGSSIKPVLGSSVESDFLGFKQLAGLDEDMALFSCRRL